MDQSQSDETPEPGDLIQIFRVGFKHWAVYVGDGYVVHVTSPPDDEVSGEASSSLGSVRTEKAMVRKQKLKEAVGNKDNKWRINNILDKVFKAHSPHIIVEKALRQVGKMIDYSVIGNNCEHFATKMRYGKAVSIQGLTAAVVLAPFDLCGMSLRITEAAKELLRSPQTD